MIRFITGTDTGVGKTVAAAVLSHQTRASGRTVRYLKPVQTGLPAGAPGDAAFVAAVAGVEANEILRFDEPLAPAVAAERAGRPIDFAALKEQTVAAAAACDVLVVEGAGGILAPLTGNRSMAAFAAAIDADVVVVTRPALGTLNHTALTLEAARSRGRPIAGLVVSGWPARPGVTERTNLDRLRRMAPILAVVRRIRGISVDAHRFEPLRAALESGRVFAPDG